MNDAERAEAMEALGERILAVLPDAIDPAVLVAALAGVLGCTIMAAEAETRAKLAGLAMVAIGDILTGELLDDEDEGEAG